MKKHPLQVIRLWRPPAVAVSIPYVAIAVCCTLPAVAAERTVLCEEFTSKR
jgi:hypothetical protein